MVLDSCQWDARYGRDLIAAHSSEFNDYIAITSPSAWAVAEPHLANPPVHREFHKGMGEDYLDDLLYRLPDASQVLAIGGGNALDVGKYVAWRKNLPLVMIPTIVSTGAVFQSPVAVRRSDRWEFFMATVAPEYLLFDYGVIRAAPPHLNRAGMGECVCQLGIVGAWRWWDAQGFGGPPFDPDLAEGTASWVRERCAEFSRDLDENGKPGETGIRIAAEINRERYDLPTWEVVARRSIDHLFIIAFEWVNRRELIHSEGVSLGSLIGAYLYESDFDETKALLDSCRVRYRPEEIGCTLAEVRETLDRINEPVGPVAPENWFHRRSLNDKKFDAMMATIESRG